MEDCKGRYEEGIYHLDQDHLPQAETILNGVLHSVEGREGATDLDHQPAESTLKELDPEVALFIASILFGLGEVRRKQGRWDESIDYYNRCLEYNNQHSLAYNNRGMYISQSYI